MQILNIPNVGSPADDPSCILPGILYVPTTPQPWPCVVGTVAGDFTNSNRLQPLTRPMQDLCKAGFLCLLQYVRLLDPIPTQTTSGKWHQQTDDLKIGIRAMRSNPFDLGFQVTGFVGTIGGSGSAHHSLYCALDGAAGVDKSDAAIALSPATDFSDRDSDTTQQFVHVVQLYGDSTNMTTLHDRSPIALDLATGSPILHYNGDHEMMPLSQLTRFAAADQSPTYSFHVNTGTLGTVHSFGMWSTVGPAAVNWMKSQL